MLLVRCVFWLNQRWNEDALEVLGAIADTTSPCFTLLEMVRSQDVHGDLGDHTITTITMMTRANFMNLPFCFLLFAKGSSKNPIVFFIRSTNLIFVQLPFLYLVIDNF